MPRKKIKKIIKTKSVKKTPKLKLEKLQKKTIKFLDLATPNYFEPVKTEPAIPAVIDQPQAKEAFEIKYDEKIAEPIILKKFAPRVSPHVLDLKQVIEAKTQKKAIADDYQQYFAEEIASQLKLQKEKINKKFNLSAVKIAKKNLIKLPQINLDPLVKGIQALKINIKLPKLPQIPAIQLGEFQLPASWLKKAVVFVTLCLITISPISAYNYYQKLQDTQGQVLGAAYSAIDNLKNAEQTAKANDFDSTTFELFNAAYNFNVGAEKLQTINSAAQNIISLIPNFGDQFNSAKNLLLAGENLSYAAALLTQQADDLAITTDLKNINLTKKIKLLADIFKKIRPNLEAAAINLQLVEAASLPSEYQDKINTLKSYLPPILKVANNFEAFANPLLKILGEEQKKKYLIVFQNNNELRPSGGFMGSFAEIAVDRGNITKISSPPGGIYDLRAGNNKLIQAPTPLFLVNKRWEIQDSNYYADFQQSAENIAHFYEISGGSTVDGVIAINATFIQNLLDLTGPINLPDYGFTLNSGNFIDQLQSEIESDASRQSGAPKLIISYLMPLLIEKISDTAKSNLPELITAFENGLKQKEIQLYFSDPEIETICQRLNFAGKMLSGTNDYLYVLNTNIAGGKTDLAVSQKVNLQSEIKTDGSVINTLTITRTHQGAKNDPLEGVNNVDYLRVYVPQDSSLIKADGFTPLPQEWFTLTADSPSYTLDSKIAGLEAGKKMGPNSTEIFNENKKTVFANWLVIAPGESKTITLVYKLPFKIEPAKNFYASLLGQKNINTYSLLVQKQPGQNIVNFDYQLLLPNNFIIDQVFPGQTNQKNNAVNLEAKIETDRIFGLNYFVE